MENPELVFALLIGLGTALLHWMRCRASDDPESDGGGDREFEYAFDFDDD
ncbi:MAG: hypothetical protein HKN23_10310 [Verrucomicrobiales bacterium]|nr:hypothetical protein [Verrucomicrobiales bacterium]